MDTAALAANVWVSSQGNHGLLLGANHGKLHVHLNKPSTPGPSSDEADADHYKVCRDSLRDPDIDRRRLIRINGRRVPRTCEWIRDNVLYRSWLTCSQQSSDTPLLWITGGPGKGKTMLSLFLIEELEVPARQKPSVTLLFYLCSSNDADHNTAVAILSGLLYQLIEQNPDLAKHAFYYLKPNRVASSLASFDTLWHIFESILGDPALQTVQCVLDGLDECERESAGWLLTAFVGQARLSAGKFRLLVLSREMAGLEDFARLRLDPDNDEPLASDIERCITDGVRRLSHPDEFALKLSNMLRAKSDGTFLWVGLILKELAKKKTSLEVLEVMHSLPEGLDRIYSRILDQIHPRRQTESAQLLRWVATTIRPLRLEELQELRRLAGCGDGPPGYRTSSLQACREQVVHCGEFLRIHDDAVHLVHQSARDYLLGAAQPFGIQPEEAHLELARHCLSCLEQSEEQNPSPLLGYAILYWPEHARQSKQHANQILERSRPFFRNGSPLGLHWWQTYRRTKEPGADDLPGSGGKISWLHVAAYFGIESWVNKTLTDAAWKIWSRKLTERDDLGRTPLHCAASGGHQAMVELLLRHRADANAKDSQGRTTLMWAAAQGHQGVTDLLIKHKVNVNAKDERKQTALGEAARQGHKEIVQRLLDLGADVEAEDVRKRRPLWLAAERGHEAVVGALLKRRPEVDRQDVWGQTALMRAAQRGHATTVQTLLDYGVGVHKRERLGERTALMMAAEGGYSAIVAQILFHGADVNGQERNGGRTALMMAAEAGHLTVVEELLIHGADVDRQERAGGRTALMWATERDEEQDAVVRVLLEHGASPDKRDCMDGRTALMRAILQNHTTVMELLLGSGADTNVKDEAGVTPLMLAVEGGHVRAASRLIALGANVNAQDRSQKWTALTRAVERNHEDLICLLLDNGTEIDARCTTQQDTALIKASEEGRQSIVQLLLDRGADIDARDWGDRTALMRAVDRDQEVVVRLLLERGADTNVNSWEEGTALMRAARRGNVAVVGLLLAFGADVNMKDQFKGQDALMAAVKADHSPVVRLLLDHDADANACSLRGETALMAAAERGNDLTTLLLLSHGATAGVADSDGHTALTRASQRGHRSVITLLNSAQSTQLSEWVNEKSKTG
ncbi:putative ankyrin repeat-containing protein [Trichoderma sp. SZMC 28015]